METSTEILRRCRVTGKYKGYYYLPKATELYMEHYDEGIQITKDIYPRIAREYNTTCFCVEHNIRTVIERCWENEKEYIENIIGYKSYRCPTNMEFIDCLAYYISKGKEEEHT